MPNEYRNTDYTVKRGPQPTFSLCHPTIRVPDGWQTAHDIWIGQANQTEEIEYILSIDYDLIDLMPDCALKPSALKIVPNGRLRQSVANYNNAFSYATGKVLIALADDWFPYEHWDTALLAAIPSLDGEYVVEVRLGGAADEGRIIGQPILTRPYYERYGYLWYPAYESMYADNDFTEQARRDGVVIDARHLLFPHYHPGHEKYGLGRDNDVVYDIENRPEAYERGKRMFEARWGNSDEKPADLSAGDKFCTALDGTGYACTRVKGHAGDHVAHDPTDRAIRRWNRLT